MVGVHDTCPILMGDNWWVSMIIFPRTYVALVWALWSVVLVLIVVGSLMMPLQRHMPWESSGISHYLAYTMLGLLPMLLRPGWNRALLLLVAASLLGAMLELIQHFLPARHGLLEDVLINAAGAATGVVLGRLAEKFTTPIACRVFD